MLVVTAWAAIPAAAPTPTTVPIVSAVVSMPNPGLFLQQDAAYRETVLPRAVRARVAVEAGVSDCWAGIVGDGGKVIGVDRFGASAPAKALFEHYGLTVENVSGAVRDLLAAVNE